MRPSGRARSCASRRCSFRQSTRIVRLRPCARMLRRLGSRCRRKIVRCFDAMFDRVETVFVAAASDAFHRAFLIAAALAFVAAFLLVARCAAARARRDRRQLRDRRRAGARRSLRGAAAPSRSRIRASRASFRTAAASEVWCRCSRCARSTPRACRLHSSREELVLALADKSEAARFQAADYPESGPLQLIGEQPSAARCCGATGAVMQRMRGRVGALVLVLRLFAAGLAAGVIHAGPTAPPTTHDRHDDRGDDDGAIVTTTTTRRDHHCPTVPTTTARADRATTPSRRQRRSAAVAACSSRRSHCRSRAGRLRVLGPAAPRRGEARGCRRRRVSRPTARSSRLRRSACMPRTARTVAQSVRSVSLFGGAVTARRVALAVRGGVADRAFASTDSRSPASRRRCSRAVRSVRQLGLCARAAAQAGGTDAVRSPCT